MLNIFYHMRQTETLVENPDEGLVQVSDSDIYAQVYDLYDEIEANLSDKGRQIISKILNLAEENYKEDPKRWDRLLGRLLKELNRLNVEKEDDIQSQYGADSYDEYDEEDEDVPRASHNELQAILNEAEAME